jgi:hypothetical protein
LVNLQTSGQFFSCPHRYVYLSVLTLSRLFSFHVKVGIFRLSICELIYPATAFSHPSFTILEYQLSEYHPDKC